MSEILAEPWKIMDDWCAKQSQVLLDQSNKQILAGVSLNDPEYRRILGQSQAFARMRSFIHAARVPPMPEGFVDPYAPDTAERLEAAMNKPVEAYDPDWGLRPTPSDRI